MVGVFETDKPLVSVVIITRNRPQMMGQCLEHVFKQDYHPYEVIVVDSSTDVETRQLAESYPNVIYLPICAQNMPISRNYGIKQAKGEIIAFIDDDSMVQAGWLKNIVSSYKSPQIGAVGGRIIDDASPPETSGAIGVILSDGEIIGNYNQDIQEEVEVEFFQGCNMSFRREVFSEVGLFDPQYTGNCLREDTDICIRVGKKGYKLIFNPHAVVKHLRAPREDYLRSTFNLRTQYYYAQNTSYFFVKNFGKKKNLILTFVIGDTVRHLKRAILSILLLAVNIFGKGVGILTAVRYKLFHKRHDGILSKSS